MSKITVIGAGNVGATTAQRAAEKGIVEQVVLIDILEGIPQGKALDLWETAPIEGYDTRVVGSNDYAATAGSDVIIMTAGLARKPGMSRDDLLKMNTQIVHSCISQAAKQSPDAVIIVVSNPLDAMTYVALKASGFPTQRVFGMAGVLDTARYRSFIAEALNVSVRDVQALVLGGHGDTMVPMPRYTMIGGVPLPELMPAEQIAQIVQRTRDGGAEIVGYLKTGSAFYAPSAAAVEMATSVILNQNRVLPSAAWLTGEYGVKDVYMGVPLKISKNGAGQVLELKLDATERAQFDASVDAVRKNL
ncbi:MAG: malate dehydrogenase, partial [Candidatus Cloacimonetes bacterium]|nr:malate dehydrogenase [Candidatus Cloacimonadota bacterium]